MKSAAFWIKHLNLLKHPEGGYFREIYRSDEKHPSGSLPLRYKGERNYSTSIYYLLEGNDYSAFHRLKSDEIWHFYSGTSMLIYIINTKGDLQSLRIGQETEMGDTLQLLLPKNQWFAAEVIDKKSYGLVGCTVSPGFDFNDFKLADKDEMIKAFPQYKELISRLI